MTDKSELLFFDTFSHESAEDLNLDLVQFPKAVIVNEVRVVPLGTRVQVDVPGGVRLGATNPSSFKLELFANNLGKRDASTFERLGILEYKENVDIQFLPENQIPTDGLIIKGWYTTITLAVYGTLTNVTVKERASPPPPPPPQPRPKQVVDSVAAAPTTSLVAKPASSLTPSDLPSLPSSKKVHKWLVDSTRTSATPVPGLQSPSSPQKKAEKAASILPFQSEYQAPPGTTNTTTASATVLSSFNQTDLARELIEVLGSVAAQTLEQQKLLNQKQVQDECRLKEPLLGVSSQPRPSFRQCEDTPASPTDASYHDNVNPGILVSRGTAVVQPVNDEQSTHQEFITPPQPITTTPSTTPMLSDIHLAEWQPPRESSGGFRSPPAHQHASVLSKSHTSVPAITVSDHPGQDISQDPISDLDQSCQAQAGHSPRDIPLEQSGRSLDPRLDPREMQSDPRSTLKDKRDLDDPHLDWRGRSSDHTQGYHSRSRSRSRSRDRDHDRRMERPRDHIRMSDPRSHRDGTRSVFEHDVDDVEIHGQHEKRSDRGRAWSRDRDRSERSRDLDRDRDRERGREFECDTDRVREVSRSHDASMSHDVDRIRDVERLRDSDRSRDVDRSHDAVRLHDSDRPHNMEKPQDVDRLHDSDRVWEDHSRTRDRDDHDRLNDKDYERERSRDLDRTRDPDKTKPLERGPDMEHVRDLNKDRGRSKELDLDKPTGPDKDQDKEWWDEDRNCEKSHGSFKNRDKNQESIEEHPDNDHAMGDTDRATPYENTDIKNQDKDMVDKPRADETASSGGAVGEDWRKEKSSDQNQETKDTKSRESGERLGKGTRSRSASPSTALYQDAEGSGMSPDVDNGYRESGAESAMQGTMNEEGLDIYISLPVDTTEQGLSDGEIQETEVYSDISSDDNMLEVDKIGDWTDYEIEDAWNMAIPTFNPYQCYVTPLETFSDPSLTEYEVQKQQLILSRCRSDPQQPLPEEAKSILNLVEFYKDADHYESWIEALEGLPALLPVGLSYIMNKTDNKEVLDTLIEWTLEGLDKDKAMAQPETAFKVRHLKMGIRLTNAMCSCDSYIVFRMMSKEVQHKLLDLFCSEYMSSSLKLQIIKVLDVTTRLKEGLDWFLGQHHLQVNVCHQLKLNNCKMDSDTAMDVDSSCDNVLKKTIIETKPTGYQRLLDIMLQKQVVRVTVAISALIRKIHIYEVLGKLNASVNILIESTSVPDNKSVAQSVNEADDQEPMDISETETPLILDNLSEEDIDTTVGCLEQATKVLKNADELIAQPKRGLPNEVQFSVRPKHDPLPGLYHMFNSCHVMESVFVLLSSPATCNHTGVFTAIRNLFHQLTTSLSGLLYLSYQSEDVINGIIRTLIQGPVTSTDYSQDEDREQHPAHQLGLHLIYVLQTLQHIDQLRLYHGKDQDQKGVDDAEALAVLQALYTMTFSPQGRDAVVYVLGLEDNVNIFMPFIQVTGDDNRDQLMRKSVCYSYSVLFLIMMLRYLDKPNWLLRFGPTLMQYIEPSDHGSAKMADKLSEIQDYLMPVKKSTNFDHDNMSDIISQLKHYSDDILELPKGLVTVLRILRQLCIAPEKSPDSVTELKYQYSVIQVFSADCMPIFYNILQKIGDLALSPWQQGFPQNSQSKAVILGIVHPVLDIMKAIICHLIQARGQEFKDLSCLSSLLHLHTVLCSWSHTGTLAPSLQLVQNRIMEIILAFTQPTVQGEDSGEALANSLWTLAMKEILKYVLLAPYTFLSGLIIISELLPLPLPIQTKEALTPEEITEVVNNRKLWSAHLHPLTPEIQKIIKSLAGSLCHPLQQVLRRVCWQLADLAVPTALTVTRCLLDTLLDQMDQAKQIESAQAEGEQQEASTQKEVKSSGEIARILNLISFLMNQAPFKAAFLALVQPGPMSEAKYFEVLPRLVHLLNIVSESPSHTHAQENIVSILQCLCDLDVSLYAGENVPFPVQLANSLPASDTVSLICTGLMEHMSQPDHKFSSILPSLRTLAMLMDHDYGFYHVKSAMEKVNRAFFTLFRQINMTFSKDSSDCIATLSSAAECIQFLVTLPVNMDGSEANMERTYTMTIPEVREVLSWSADNIVHPLDDLDKLLCDYAKEEETLKAVYESVNSLVTVLKSEEEECQTRPEIIEPKLPPAELLTNQFAQRTIYTLTDDEDDRLSATYWLATPMLDDLEFDTDLVPCNFEEMVQTYCPDFDLKAEVEKGSLPSDITATKPRIKRRRGNDTINTSRMRGNRGAFVAPMRGRGFGRTMNLIKNDPFRSRPPNTSRPPSMHVDDFVKMESQNNSSALSSGVNQRQQRADKEGSNRGRGFDRGGRGFFSGGRGNHFSRSGGSTGNYSRREQNRGGSSQRGGFAFRGNMTGGSNRGGTTQRGSRGGQLRGNATSQGSPMGNRGSPVKNSSPWRTRQQGGYTSRTFGRGDSRAGSTERGERRRENAGNSRFSRGRGSTGWSEKGKDRFAPSGGFHRRERGSGHRRAFTK